jgi:hypothetical protein
LPRRPWPAGEELRFSLHYGILNAGTAVLRVEGPLTYRDRPCWRLTAEVASGGMLSTIYRVRDHLASVADTCDLRCLQIETRIVEGSYHERVQADLDHEAGQAAYATGKRARITPGCHDVLAAWYRARCLDLAVGDTCALPVLISGGMHTLRLTVAGRRPRPTPWGERMCLTIEAWLDGLAPGRAGGDLRLDVTDNVKRLPVRIEVSVPFGHLAAVLESTESSDLPESDTP